MKTSLMLLFMTSLMFVGNLGHAQTFPPQPKTTNVLVTLTVKQGVTREQIVKTMPAEIQATVRLYLDGKIQQWYSRGDGKGVIFLLASKDVTEARAIIDTLPFSKENIMDLEFIPVGPLMPLGTLLNSSTH